MKLCFATNNAHKLSEIRAMLRENLTIVSLADIGCFEDLAETQPTLEGNSLQKAAYVYEQYAISVFADDTGLEIEALHGEPGVVSARYAGPERDHEANISLVLQKLAGKPNRAARFRTVITLIVEGNIRRFEGIVKGRITSERKGTAGFGYDPVFVPEGYECTFAEMEVTEKNAISHRGRAVRKLTDFLNRQYFE